MTLIQLMFVTFLCLLSACQNPPPEVDLGGTPPAPGTEMPAAAAGQAPPATHQEGDLARHLYGQDTYPCTGHEVCDRSSPADGALSLAGGGVKSIDPGHMAETAGARVIENIFEGLVMPAITDGPVAPGVAERWTVSKDGKVYTFFLRKNASWSNGRNVTAEDFRYSWIRKLRPETASVSAEHHFFIQGAKAFNTGQAKDPKSVGIKVLDTHTLEVTLKASTPFFLEYVKSGHYAPVPRETVETYGKRWTRPEHIVTNGPYHLSEWTLRQRMVLEKSPTYWDAAGVRIPKAVIHHSESESTEWTRYQAGDQHYLFPVKTTLIHDFMRAKRPDFFIDPLLCYYYYAFRMDRPPFDNPLIRKAFAMAFDKERLVSHVTKGMQVVADGPVPKFFDASMGFRDNKGVEFDPKGARKLLAEAGYPGGRGLPVISLVYNTYESHKIIAEFAQRNLKENLGVTIHLANMEWKSLLSKLKSGDYQMARFGWCAINEPYGFLKIFRSDSSNNRFAYSNDNVDRLLDRSMATKDSDSRIRLLSKAEELIQQDNPNLPLYYYTNPYLKTPVLRGLEPESGNSHLIKYMYWGDKEYDQP